MMKGSEEHKNDTNIPACCSSKANQLQNLKITLHQIQYIEGPINMY